MGRQYNKVEKRSRRGAYCERRKAAIKSPAIGVRKKK